MLKHDPVGLVRNFETRLDPAFLCSDTFLDQHISRHNWPHWCGINIGNEQFFFLQKNVKSEINEVAGTCGMSVRERCPAEVGENFHSHFLEMFHETFHSAHLNWRIVRMWQKGDAPSNLIINLSDLCKSVIRKPTWSFIQMAILWMDVNSNFAVFLE